MRIVQGIVAFGLFVFIVGAALGAASQRDHDDCYKESGDSAIAVCTRVIQDRGQSARSRALAYYNRGNAYRDKDDRNRAIADYTEAIRLNPKFGDAYYNRGNAYRDKGDRNRAIAEYRRAVELGDREAREELRKLGVTP